MLAKPLAVSLDPLFHSNVVEVLVSWVEPRMCVSLLLGKHRDFGLLEGMERTDRNAGMYRGVEGVCMSGSEYCLPSKDHNTAEQRCRVTCRI